MRQSGFLFNKISGETLQRETDRLFQHLLVVEICGLFHTGCVMRCNPTTGQQDTPGDLYSDVTRDVDLLYLRKSRQGKAQPAFDLFAHGCST